MSGEATCDLDVGVIYTRERRFMPPLLTTMREAAGNLSIRLLLVDNAANDGVADWLDYVRPTTVLVNPAPLSYAANLNRILRAATAPFVLLMNTDMYFDPAEPCLEKMVRFMQAHRECGLSICRLYRPDGSYGYPARRFQTPAVIAARRLGLGRLLTSSLDRYLYRRRIRFESFECEWVSGCFMLVRREAALEVGELDTRYSKYFEDVDYCGRMARAGWRVMFHGGTYCYHHEQRASHRMFSLDAWHHVRSYLRWLARGVRRGAFRQI